MPKQMEFMSSECWNGNISLVHTLILVEFLTPNLNGTGEIHLKLCLGSYTPILIFQSFMVTDNYTEVAIKEIKVFNHDLIPVNPNEQFSQIYATNEFHKDDEKENI